MKYEAVKLVHVTFYTEQHSITTQPGQPRSTNDRVYPISVTDRDRI